MKCLVDTNVWIQVLRQRVGAEQVVRFLETWPADQLFVTDYSVHSIGLVLERFGQLDRYADFLRGSGIGEAIEIVSLDRAGLVRVPQIAREQKLDFDDAYQYVVAETHDLTIVSFDRHFDKTPRGRIEPAQAMRP